MVNDQKNSIVDAVNSIPKSLDDIVRQNREHLQIREATTEEIHALRAEINPDPRHVKDRLHDWTIASFILESNPPVLMVLGDRERDGMAIRSNFIVGIDMDRGFLTTESGSIYQLGTKAQDDPSIHQLSLVCEYLFSRRMGKRFLIPILI